MNTAIQQDSREPCLETVDCLHCLHGGLRSSHARDEGPLRCFLLGICPFLEAVVDVRANILAASRNASAGGYLPVAIKARLLVSQRSESSSVLFFSNV